MKNMICVLLLFSSPLVGCIYTLHNDTEKRVFIVNDKGQGVFLQPGESQKLMTKKSSFWRYVAKERLFVYLEDSQAKFFNLTYRLTDNYCSSDTQDVLLSVAEIEAGAESLKKRMSFKRY